LSLFELIPGFLRQLRSPLIESVQFQIDLGWQVTDYEALRGEIPLRALSEILSRHLGSLTEVVFEIWRSFELSHSLDELEQQMKDDIGYPFADIVKLRRPLKAYEELDFL
jgi:hypothetical protein